MVKGKIARAKLHECIFKEIIYNVKYGNPLANTNDFITFLYLCQVAYAALFPEDIPSNKIILKVSAKDADIGSNGDIRYSLYGSGNDEFFLDPESGKVKCILWVNAIVNP